MKEKITRTNLNKAKEKVVMDYLENLRKEAEENTKEVFKQFEKINFGRIPEEEEINAKRNRR